jgi:hypothetical protein
MSIQFRNTRLNRSYLSKVVAAGASDKKPAANGTLPGANGNARPSSPAAPQRGAVRHKDASMLESNHPEIARAISLLWGFPEMNEYFDRLWLADGDHGPIDPEAMSDLMLLSRVHQTLMPQRPTRTLASFHGADRIREPRASTNDVWGDVPPRR